MKRSMMAGIVMGSVLLGIGCSSEAPTAPTTDVGKPSAAVKVTASLRTSKISGLKTWQVYTGFGHVAALGFDKKGKPVDGLRMVFADSSGPVKGLRFETVKGRRVLQLDEHGEVVKNTMAYGDLRTLYGGFQVITAFAKSTKHGTLATKAMRAFADDCSLTDTLIDAGSACAGPLWCAGKALVGRKAKEAVDCFRNADAGTKVACGAAAAPAAKCAAEKVQKALGGEDKAKKAADDAAQKASAQNVVDPKEGKDGTEKDPSQDPSKDPTDPNDPNADPNDPNADPNDPNADPNPDPSDPNADPNASCSDANDPACDPATQSDPETNCVGGDDAACTGDQFGPEETGDEPAEDPDANSELDPNPDDPDTSASPDDTQEQPPAEETTPEETPAPSEDGPIETSLRGGLHLSSYKGSTSRSVAKRLGGACSASHFLQCSVRKSRAFCRCVKP